MTAHHNAMCHLRKWRSRPKLAYRLGRKAPALLIDGEAKPFDPAAFAACAAAAPGYSMGFDAVVRAQSITDAVRFLQRSP